VRSGRMRGRRVWELSARKRRFALSREIGLSWIKRDMDSAIGLLCLHARIERALVLLRSKPIKIDEFVCLVRFGGGCHR
jgi:hypothetical protein